SAVSVRHDRVTGARACSASSSESRRRQGMKRMDERRFDDLSRQLGKSEFGADIAGDRAAEPLSNAGGRRNLIGSLGAAGLALLASLGLGELSAAADGKNGGKKKKKGASGPQAEKKKKKRKKTPVSPPTSGAVGPQGPQGAPGAPGSPGGEK